MLKAQRFLMAVARGARLQRLGIKKIAGQDMGFWEVWRGRPPYGWIPHNLPQLLEAGTIRIHPHDQHLQYGRLSTVTRELALYDVSTDKAAAMAASSMVARETDFEAHFNEATMNEIRMFMLFFAEYLADQGL